MSNERAIRELAVAMRKLAYDNWRFVDDRTACIEEAVDRLAQSPRPAVESRDSTPAGEPSCEEQIEILATWALDNWPALVTQGGAVECVMRVLRVLRMIADNDPEYGEWLEARVHELAEHDREAGAR